MSIVTRLKEYIEYTGLPYSQFADNAAIPRPTLSQIIGGRNKKVSHELIEKLHAGYPKLNINWLLFGDQPMEVDGQPQTETAEAKTNEDATSTSKPKADNKSLFESLISSGEENKEIDYLIVIYKDSSHAFFHRTI